MEEKKEHVEDRKSVKQNDKTEDAEPTETAHISSLLSQVGELVYLGGGGYGTAYAAKFDTGDGYFYFYFFGFLHCFDCLLCEFAQNKTRQKKRFLFCFAKFL